LFLISLRRGIKLRHNSTVLFSEKVILIRWPINFFSVKVSILGSILICSACFNILFHCCPVKYQNFYLFNISLLCSFEASMQLPDYKYFAALHLILTAAPRKYL
jgi:hypothetical protein